MIKLLIEGIVLGFTLAFMIGPAFFSLIQTSISRGFKSGMQLAVGISVSDTILVFLVNLGVIHIIDDPTVQLLIGSVGGLILIGFGTVTYMRKEITHVSHEIDIDKRISKALTYFLKGLFLNFLNPFVWFFWVAVAVGMSASLETKENMLTFYAATLITLISTDLLKCFIANKIKRLLSARLIFMINKVVGLFLLVFGIVLIIRVIIENYSKF